MKNYLSSKLNMEVHFFDPYQFLNADRIDQDEKLRKKFCQTAVLTTNAEQRGKLINFLKGDLALTKGSGLPIDSIVFLSVRMGIIALCLSIYFLAEMMITSGKLKTADKVLKSLAKNVVVRNSFSGRNLRAMTGKKSSLKAVAQVNQKLVLKNREIKQEVKTIQSALNTNAIKNLTQIITMIGSSKVELTKFVTSEMNNLDFTLTAKEFFELEKIAKKFNNDKAQKWIVDLEEKKLTLNISGKGLK